jgi:hypothetical protein
MTSSQKSNARPKAQSLLFWILAVVITLASAYYQRVTGPTHSIGDSVQFGESIVTYTFARTHGGEGGAPVAVSVGDTSVTGTLVWRRYPTGEPWTQTLMQREGHQLVARLPHQPPAGKVEYHVLLFRDDEALMIPTDRAVVLRYKGAVPSAILLPHVLLIFAAMLLSTRAGLEALTRHGKTSSYVAWAAGLTLVGGMIFGPLVQYYAFGAAWTGVPFGWDLTDNKTLIAMIGWAAAFIATRRNRPARGWVLGASILMFVIFLIPHSVLGSQLDYTKVAQP